jgi:hypothetical protein
MFWTLPLSNLLFPPKSKFCPFCWNSTGKHLLNAIILSFNVVWAIAESRKTRFLACLFVRLLFLGLLLLSDRFSPLHDFQITVKGQLLRDPKGPWLGQCLLLLWKCLSQYAELTAKAS